MCRTAFGNVLVGPTAEEQDDRERATVDEATLRGLIARAAEMVPALAQVDVTAVYAGLRPATEEKAYRISVHRDRNWITVGGIRSTGLTASLGIARHVYDLYEKMGRRHTAVAEPMAPRVPNLAEHCPRDWQSPGYGEIVCHCELVTLREIEHALSGPVAGARLWRPAAAHAVRHGPMPRVQLQRAARSADGGPLRVAAGDRGRCMMLGAIRCRERHRSACRRARDRRRACGSCRGDAD